MARILYNKNVLAPSAVTPQVFTTGQARFGEIVICNDLNEPGIYIYTRAANGETKIQKINDVENIILKNDIDMTVTGDVVAGDTLEQIVSKLQNQSTENRENIAEEEGRAEAAEEALSNRVSGLSGTTLVFSSSTVHEVERLDERIDTEIHDTMVVVSGLSAGTMDEIGRVDGRISSFSSSTMSEVRRIDTVISDFSAGTEAQVSRLGEKILSENAALSANTVTEVRRLDDRITTEIADLSASTVNEVNRLDGKIESSIDALDTSISLPEGELITSLSETNGVISGGSKALSIVKDDTGLIYDLKLGDFTFGRIDIPQDQFLSGATFIQEATMVDVNEAYNAGQTIELGKPYLKFVWILEDDVQSPTFVDVSSLIDVYNAKDIKLSEEYDGNEFGIVSGKSLEEVVGLITNEIVSIEADVTERSMSSSDGTVIVTKSSSGTSLTANIDNDTIVKSELVSSLGVLSTSLSVDKANYDSGNVKTKYTLRSKNGEYGVINDTRDIVSGGKFVNITTGSTADESGVRTDTVNIALTTQDVIDNAQGPEVENSNGLVTAWGIKNYVRNEVNGHVIMVGNEDLIDDRDYEYWRGKINFNELSADYDSIHGALLKTDNNFQILDETIGLPISGRSIHLYPSAMTENATVIKNDRTIMGALVSLDTAIGNMDWTGTTNENEVFDSISQDNGNMSATARNLTSVKIGGYEVQEEAKVADTDTLGNALGKLQGQIDALDWTGTTKEDEVFSIITEADGKISAGTRSISGIKISDYEVGSDTKVTSADTIGQAFGKLQGQIDAMDLTSSASEETVIVGLTQVDGKVTAEYRQVSQTKIDSITTANTKVADGDTIATAVGKLQGQIDSMDKSSVAEENSIIYDVTEDDGVVSTQSKHLTDIKLSGLTIGETGKISASDTLGSALSKLQGQVNGLDWTGTTANDSVFTAITQDDGVLSAATALATSRVMTGYAVGSDAKLAATDTLGGALGKLQGQINAMDLTSSASEQTVVVGVSQVDGKVTAEYRQVSQTKIDNITASDTKVSNGDTVAVAVGKLQGQINAMDKSAASETGKFVRTVAEADGKVSETLGYITASDINIASASPANVNIREAYKLVNAQGTQLGSTINIYKDQTLKSVALSGDASTTGQWLVFTYILADGSESKVSVDVSKFLVQAEFSTGVAADNNGVVKGVVDPSSESFLSVGANGFKLSGVQTAINNAVSGLDSTTATTNTGYALTSVTITNGKITARGETAKVHSAETAANADKLGNTALTGLLTAFSSTTGTAPTTSINVGGTVKTANINADTIDGYHIVVGSTGTTNNTIYIL